MKPHEIITKWFWLILGFLLTGLGFLGMVLPGFPGTIWLILAAGCFARSNPRWEAWLLSRPVVGQLIDDYRAGRGMPLRAKWIACLSIIVAVGFSLPRIPVPVGQVAAVVLGIIGVVYITRFIPTRR